MDKIEILDRDKKTKAVYRLDKEEHLEGYQEEREYNSWLEVVISSIFKVLRFNLYLIMSFLKLLSRKEVKQDKEKQDKKAKDYIIRNTKPHATTTHNYEFIRSKLFARNYLKIDKLLEKCAKHDAELNNKLYQDIMKRLDIIIVEAERQALSEGYKYAKQTRYKFESQEAFDKYIQDRIMRGEDYREHNRELLEELEEGYNK